MKLREGPQRFVVNIDGRWVLVAWARVISNGWLEYRLPDGTKGIAKGSEWRKAGGT